MTSSLRQAGKALLAEYFPGGGSERLLAIFISASIPAALLAAWHVGVATASPQGVQGWFGEWMSLWHGLLRLFSMVAVAAACGFAWECIFAALRRRGPDASWLMSAWLFALLLPPTTPLWLVIVGMSFGALFGSQLFGGTGCYVASPAVVGALFLQFSYPSILAGELPWIVLANDAAMDNDTSLASIFFLVSAAGAFTLVAAGAASARSLCGALLALLFAAAIDDSRSVAEHATTGSFAFCWAFLLTDPTTQALTQGARWLHGAAFASLVVLIRATDPAQPDGVLFAVLLAGLLVPLFDFLVLSVQQARHRETCGLRR